MTRVCIILNTQDEPFDFLVPDPQPVGTWLSLVAAPSWWKRKGHNAVLVASSLAPELDHVVVCRYGVAVPELLPPAHDPADHRVDVYNTGSEVAAGEDIVPGAMLFMQRPGSRPPQLPSVQSIISDQSLDCSEDQLPRPAAPSPLTVRASDVQVWFQKMPAGVFGDVAVRGRTARKCVAFRDRGTLPASASYVLFADPCKVGLPVTSFSTASCLLRAAAGLPAPYLRWPTGCWRPSCAAIWAL